MPPDATAPATPPLELCGMSARQATLVELIDVAGRHGYDRITVTMNLYQRAALSDAELRRRLDDAGVTIAYIDGLTRPLPGVDSGATEDECYAMADALGIPAVNLVHLSDPTAVPFAELLDGAVALAERVADHGLMMLNEFVPEGAFPDLASSLELVRAAGAHRANVLLDTWHFARSGGRPEEIVGDVPALVGGLQVSDRRKVQDTLPYVPMTGRHQPGDGDVPLVDILRPIVAARPDVGIGVEVISEETKAMTPDEAAAVCGRSLRALVAQLV